MNSMEQRKAYINANEQILSYLTVCSKDNDNINIHIIKDFEGKDVYL